MIIEKIDANII